MYIRKRWSLYSRTAVKSKLYTGMSKQMNETKLTKESLLALGKQTEVPGANFIVK